MGAINWKRHWRAGDHCGGTPSMAAHAGRWRRMRWLILMAMCWCCTAMCPFVTAETMRSMIARLHAEDAPKVVVLG
jgi:hypothetical protein